MVIFSHDKSCMFFNKEGKSSCNAINRFLFWDEVKFEIPEQPKRLISKWIVLYLGRDHKWYPFYANNFKLFDSHEEALKFSKSLDVTHVINEVKIYE